MKLLHDAIVVTSEKEVKGSILIDGDRISDVLYADREDYPDRIREIMEREDGLEIVELEGKHVMAGGIDAHVHFREPGLTHKADMATESRAAAAGGVTYVIDMPNTIPPTTDSRSLKEKIAAAQGRTAGRIAFHIGATNSNAEQICRMVKEGDMQNGLSSDDIAGVKVFMGSSTGNMLVDSDKAIEQIFSIKEKPVLVHCEDEQTIKADLEAARERYGEDIPFEEHERIRSRKACIRSSIKALELAMKHQTRLVLCHISTKEELEMVRAAKATNPGIIAETSCNYLWFSNEDYSRLGSLVKCNPSVKTPEDRAALRRGLAEGTIDTIGSDHAPHLLSEKQGTYCNAPSGLPSIQQTLPVLLTIAEEEGIPLTRIASVFSENASRIYGLRHGRIQPGYYADLVIFDRSRTFTVRNEEQLSKCGWTPYDGEELRGVVESVLVNGQTVF